MSIFDKILTAYDCTHSIQNMFWGFRVQISNTPKNVWVLFMVINL